MKKRPNNFILWLLLGAASSAMLSSSAISMSAAINLTSDHQSLSTSPGSKSSGQLGEWPVVVGSPASAGRHSNRHAKQTRHSTLAAGNSKRATKANETKPTSSSKTSPSTAEPEEASFEQEQARLLASYTNTPPVLMNQVRDLFVDVAKLPLGSRVTTIRAFDVEADPLRYSLRPAGYRDASGYFAINATSGELKLAHKQFKYRLPLGGNDSSGSLRAPEVSPAEGEIYNERQVELAGEQPPEEADEPDKLSRNLYFLTVFVDDGHLGNNAEFNVHVVNSTSVASIQSLPSVAVLGNEMERIMERKSNEYYSSLYNGSITRSRGFPAPTLVYPDYANPAPLRPAGLEGGPEQEQPAIEEIQLVPKGAQQPLESGNGRELARVQQPLAPLVPTALLEGNELLASHRQESALSQRMLVSLVLVCSALLISMVLLMFIVPLSVKRLRKRLKEVEQRHEHLSKRASNNSSFLSAAGHHQAHHCHNSSLSQFTLGSEASSCPRRQSPICRLSSVDSAQTAAAQCQLMPGSLQQSASLFNGSPPEGHRQASLLAGERPFGFQPPARHSAAIIANPVFLHHHHQQQQQLVSNLPIMQAHSYQLSTLQSNKVVAYQAAGKRQQQALYHPLDENLYCTIQTETANVDDLDDLVRTCEPVVQNLFRRNANQCQQPPAKSAPDCHPPNSKLSSLTAMGSSSAGAADGTAGESAASEESCQKRQRLVGERSKSPSGSVGSTGSSTNSLARFLSLPARHQSHTNTAYTSGSTEDLNSGAWSGYAWQTGSSGSGEQLLNGGAKTIARTDRDANAPNWELERHKLKFLGILDEGQFGLVLRYKLRLSSGSERVVAVKTLKSGAAKDQRSRNELLAEIEIMKLVNKHPNVVKLLHCCTLDTQLASSEGGTGKPILLVMEYVELGKLQSFLEKCRYNHYYATTTTTNNACLPTSSRTLANVFNEIDDEIYDTHSADYIVSSSAPNNNNNNITINNNNAAVTSKELIKFMYHVAKGMEYLASKCIVHRDLASRNILLSLEGVCKIGDFGMARHMHSHSGVYERSSRNAKIPVRWMAPEVLLQNTFTTKSDVYSFGILMWEIVTLATTPYQMLKTEQVIEEVARKGQRPEKPEYCHKDLYEIMQQCWSERANFRPTFRELVKQLNALLISANNYIELDQYPDVNYYNVISRNSMQHELL